MSTEQSRWTLEWLDTSEINPAVSNACAYDRHKVCEGFCFTQVRPHTWYTHKPCLCPCHAEVSK